MWPMIQDMEVSNKIYRISNLVYQSSLHTLFWFIIVQHFSIQSAAHLNCGQSVKLGQTKRVHGMSVCLDNINLYCASFFCYKIILGIFGPFMLAPEICFMSFAPISGE